MNSGVPERLAGYGFLAICGICGISLFAFGDFVSVVRPWLDVTMGGSLLAAVVCLWVFPAKAQYEQRTLHHGAVVEAIDGSRRQLSTIADLVEGVAMTMKNVDSTLARMSRHMDSLDARITRLADERDEIGGVVDDGRIDREFVAAAATERTRRDWDSTLREAWNQYFECGDGNFNARGFEAVLVGSGVETAVRHLGDDAGRTVLVIDNPDADDGSAFVVPDFTKSPASVEAWFVDDGDGKIGGRIVELRRVAKARWSSAGSELEVVEMGSVA